MTSTGYLNLNSNYTNYLLLGKFILASDIIFWTCLCISGKILEYIKYQKHLIFNILEQTFFFSNSDEKFLTLGHLINLVNQKVYRMFV